MKIYILQQTHFELFYIDSLIKKWYIIISFFKASEAMKTRLGFPVPDDPHQPAAETIGDKVVSPDEVEILK